MDEAELFRVYGLADNNPRCTSTLWGLVASGFNVHKRSHFCPSPFSSLCLLYGNMVWLPLIMFHHITLAVSFVFFEIQMADLII